MGVLWLFNPAIVSGADQGTSLNVLWLPQTIYKNTETVIVYDCEGALDWEARFFIRQGEHWSGSVKQGDEFTTAYIPLKDLVDKDGHLRVVVKIGSGIDPGPVIWKMAARKVGSTKKGLEVKIGDSVLVDSGEKMSGTTKPDVPVGLITEGSRYPYSDTVSNTEGAFTLTSDKKGEIAIITRSGQEVITNYEGADLADESPVTEDVEEEIIQEEPLKPIDYSGIYISALYPDPVAPETDAKNEWTEISSDNPDPVDLSSLILKDTKGAIVKYVIQSNTYVSKGKPVKLLSSETKINLNNDGDSVVLETPEGELVSESAAYTKAKPGVIWYKKGDTWQWDESETEEETTLASISSTSDDTVSKSEPPKEIAIEDTENNVGNLVKVEGIVSTKTSTGFYLVDQEDADNKVRIYLNTDIRFLKDKALKGELWSIVGVMENYQGSLRLSPRNAADLVKLKDAPKAITASKVAVKTTASKVSTTSKAATARAPTVAAAAKKNLPNAPPESMSNIGKGTEDGANIANKYPWLPVGAFLSLWWTIVFKMR